MEFIQAKVPHPNIVNDYKNTSFEFDVKEVHPVEQMDMHMQIGEMIFSTLTNTSLNSSNLQVSLNNIQSQLKLDKISSLAKDNNIESLEELVLNIGYDRSNVKADEEFLKKKNVDIESLKNQLKLPTTEYSQTKEVAKTKGHKEEMLKMIMEQNAQIREMEVEMDKLIKEKEHSVHMDIIPLEAIPLIGVWTT
jgi:glucosamine 6-phosphate synthetase-like amidotransferase/phosphosugar isomerase protein